MALEERALVGEEFELFVDKYFRGPEQGDLGLGVLVRKDDGRVIGFAGAISCSYWTNETELGFVLDSPFWGHEYAVEIGRAILDEFFQKLRYERLLALVNPQNRRSLKVIKKLGLRDSGEAYGSRGLRRIFASCREDWASAAPSVRPPCPTPP